MTEASEDAIRDKLAEDLSFLSADYKLIKPEYYLNNVKGTKGYIDILASDAESNYVIIEIKRSNQSAREALHEILKYIEALKEIKNIKEDEVKVILVSTEWKELIVPFSSFYHRTKITLEGIDLSVDKKGKPLSKKAIIPNPENFGRVISPVHGCYFYTSKKELEKGISSIKECYNQIGLFEHVIVILESVNKDYPYKYIAYSAYSRLSKIEYLEILKKDEEQFTYTMEEIEENNFEEKDIIRLCEVNIDNIEPFPYSESVEISYPAKFSKYSNGELFKVKEIKRSEVFSKNKLLSDETILSELRGEQGITSQIFDKTFHTMHKAGYSQANKEIQSCLEHNIIWRNHCKIILDYYEQKGKKENFKIESHIFTPNNILLTINSILSGEKPVSVTPIYYIIVKNDNESLVKYYSGQLKWNKSCPDFNSLINKYYSGDPFNMFLPMLWGGFEENDLRIMRDLGLEYITLLHTYDDKGEHDKKLLSAHVLDGYEFKDVTCSHINYKGLKDLLDTCTKFSEIMYSNYNQHHFGGIFFKENEKRN